MAIDRLRGLCCEILAAGLDGGHCASLEVIDPRAGRLETLVLLALLCDGDRQRLLGSVERSHGIAHLLIEDH